LGNFETPKVSEGDTGKFQGVIGGNFSVYNGQIRLLGPDEQVHVDQWFGSIGGDKPSDPRDLLAWGVRSWSFTMPVL
jgi:hypothetical protein